MAKYKTLKGMSNGTLKDRGSKFIAYASNANTEDGAKAFIEKIWKEHPKARHVCYAYSIGLKPKIIRTQDDGEPGNTGGQPILNYIQKYELDNVVVAVVRYFGGVLLGKGGLINAYGGAAEEALKAANIIKKSEMTEVLVELPYETYAQAMDVLKSIGAEIISEEFKEACKLKCRIEKDLTEEFIKRLKTVSNNSMIFKAHNLPT